MSKITVKSTKEQMTSYLNKVFKSVQKANKNLADRIAYTGKAYKKDPASVMKKDLYDLCKESMELLDFLTPATPVVAESSVKPTGKKKLSKKAEPVKEEAKDIPEEPQETPSTPAKASGKKKAVTKKSAKKEEPIVTPVETATKSEKEVTLAKMFKEKIESPALGTLEIAHDIKTMDDLKKSIEKEEVLVFAMYWTARMIKQFSYGSNINLHIVPKSFKDDLDLATLIYIGEVNDIAWAVSSDTDAMYSFNEEDLVEEDGLRFTNGGVEYQIYRQTAEPKA